MDTVETQDKQRKNGELADLICHALSIQKTSGCVVAWAYLSKLDVPPATILRVLTNSADARQYSVGSVHGTN